MKLNSLSRLEDPKQCRAELTGFFTELQGGISDLVAQLPEQFRSQFVSLKNKTDEVLRGLASTPTDQVPAANEASYGLRSLAYALMSLNEQYASVMQAMKDIGSKYTGMATEVQSLTGLKTAKESGELIAKADHEAAVNKAVQEAEGKLNAKFKLLGTRRTELQSLGLPIPADAVLEVEEKNFGELKTSGQNRLKKLTDLGVATELQGDELSALVYGPAVEYDRTLKVAEKARGKGGERREPMMGGTGAGSGGGEGVKVRRGF